MQLHRSPRRDFDDLCNRDRDVTSATHRDRQRHRRERAEDHHHYRDGQQRRASGKRRTKRTEENTALNGNVPAATEDGTVESYQLVDDVTEGSLMFNDDGSYTFLQASSDFDDLPGSR
ncbi:hypothetical protein O9992_19765 [Vibrio lentus]|nr:hypothetical protein [Vibrio lentus]